MRSESKREKARKTGASATTASGKAPPPPVDEDDETWISSVRTWSLRMLLEDPAKDAESRVEPSTTKKSPHALSTPELVEMRRNDEVGWRRLIRENTVMAVASSIPTDQDRKKAAENTRRAASHRQRVSFNDRVETILAPVGQPYTPNQQITKQTDMEKTRKGGSPSMIQDGVSV